MFLENLVGKKIKLYFIVFDKAAGRYDITGVLEEWDEDFVKISSNEKKYLISRSQISFIEYVE